MTRRLCSSKRNLFSSSVMVVGLCGSSFFSNNTKVSAFSVQSSFQNRYCQQEHHHCPSRRYSSQNDQVEARAALEFAKLVGRLKTTPRQGWKMRGIPNYESVADHSWSVAALCFLLDPSQYDLSKTLPMAVLHDLAEALVGDITPEDKISKSEKQQLEADAMDRILNHLQLYNNNHSSCNVDRIQQLFQEYEERQTPEAKAVKDLDKLDMILQATVYEQQHDALINLDEFFDGTPASSFYTPEIAQLATLIHQQRADRRRNSKNHSSSKKKNAGAGGEGRSSFLSERDQSFVKAFSRGQSEMKEADIKSVVEALRGWEEDERREKTKNKKEEDC